MIRSILVPLDGSDFAEHALPIAASLARQAGAVVHLAHAHAAAMVDFSMGIAIPPVSDLQERQDEQAYLADVARRLTEKAPLTVKSVLLDGDVVEALKEYAGRESINLVVMATHARGALGRFWLGSVADELTAGLTAPVLLVRPGEGKPDLGRDAGLKSIVVPLDGSPQAEGALWPAAELAQLFDAELALVRVNQPAILPSYLPEGAGGYSVLPALEQADQIESRERVEAQEYLGEVASMLALRGVRMRTDVLVEERAAAGILAEADARHAGLIAIETHNRRGLARLFFGSVADEVVRGGEVPVLLHHAAG
jgi:nucleotide-binding universal stress UspA family protein